MNLTLTIISSGNQKGKKYMCACAYKRILLHDVEARVLLDKAVISLAKVFISSLLLTRPHCWHVNPFPSADSNSKKFQIGHMGQRPSE